VNASDPAGPTVEGEPSAPGGARKGHPSRARLLRPEAYLSFARTWAGHLPATRAIARNWRTWALRQLLRPALALPCMIETRVGTRFYLGDDPIDDAILRHLMHDAVGIYFPEGAVVPPGGLIVDAGAHHGIYATEALCRSPGARLIAVEPNPEARAYFERNLAANGMLDRVEYVAAALGRRGERGFLELGEASWYDSTVREPGREPSPAGVPVPVVSIVDVLRGRRPDLVKLNAEGAEFQVIPELIENGILPDWLVLMIHEDRGSGSELIALLERSGYEVRPADGREPSSRVHCRLRRGA
jgi:FkbM family methyltransferase